MLHISGPDGDLIGYGIVAGTLLVGVLILAAQVYLSRREQKRGPR
jgi:hypothetical protein